MSEYSIRSDQLRNLKIKFIVKDVVFSFLTFFLTLFLFIVYLVLFSIDNMDSTFFSPLVLIVIIILTFCLIVCYTYLLIRIIKKDNRSFHQMYLDYLFDECRLEEIYYKFRKKQFDSSLFEDYNAFLGIKIKRINYSLLDASPTRILDYMQMDYIKDKEIKYGVLMSIKVDVFFDGFLQIRTHGEPLNTDYENKKIQRFGFSLKSVLSKFEVFSSLGSRTYNLDSLSFSKVLKEFADYLKTDFVITLKGNMVSIFIETFQFNLTSGYFAYKQDDFERKINSLIRLHKLSDELLNELMSYKA